MKVLDIPIKDAGDGGVLSVNMEHINAIEMRPFDKGGCGVIIHFVNGDQIAKQSPFNVDDVRAAIGYLLNE